MTRNRLRLSQRWGSLAGAIALALSLGSVAHAGPRDDMSAAYEQATNQFNELELDSAIATLEAAIARAQGAGMATDPGLAPLLILRGGIIYSSTGDRSRTLAAFQEAVRADYNISLPIELRSDELQSLLDEARAGVPNPGTGPLAHTPPAAVTGQDIVLEALSSVPVSDGATIVLYWKKAGAEGEFAAVYLETFGNLGSVTIPAAQHGDSNIEYFFYVYDANQAAMANLGDKDAPLTLTLGEGGSTEGGEGDGEGEGEGEGKGKGKRASSTAWPRAYINLGIGTGVGIARGSAELTYQQFTPGAFGGQYGTAEQACAIARWHAGPDPIASNPVEFSQALAEINPAVLPGGDADTLLMNYNAERCGRRQGVTTGFASAPMHLAPEIAVRIHDRDIGERRSLSVVLGLFGRLQVVTGSKVITENPDANLEESFNQEVLSPNPPGFQRKPDFTWAAGVKLKALITKRGGKFQGMVGLFGGYGRSRLRVNMGFSNDRNGNSVPDRAETALSGPADANNQVPIDMCTPVWPYNNGCMNSEAGVFDQQLAASVQGNANGNELRIDTVKLGPAFAGVLFGFNYQLHKNFALYGEVDVGGWFPDIGSLLIDISAGPAITF